ncbi:MAG: saccharopine dehydrogenase [Nocardioidaceae bacterium]
MAKGVQPKTERQYDVVLFGATGFTVVSPLNTSPRMPPPGCAGRSPVTSETKLAAVRRSLAAIDSKWADLPLIVVDATDADTLGEVAASTKVICTTVGPYLQHGEPLVAACAAKGTDYVDLTGEPEFVDTMFVKYHDLAQRNGARIVHACGFDSIPHDLGAWWTVQQLDPAKPIQLRGVVRTGAGFSGGTYHSALDQLSRSGQMRQAMQARREYEKRPKGRKVRAVQGKPGRDSLLGYYLLPLPTIDPFIVARSAAALDAYGPEFTYSHFAGLKTLTYTVGGVAAVVTLGVAAKIPPVRSFLKSRVKQGTGPSAQQRERSWFTVDFIAEQEGKTLHTRVSGGDPGYTETSKMLAESAMCLALDENPAAAGSITTAQAMAVNLHSRLEQAGINFEVI